MAAKVLTNTAVTYSGITYKIGSGAGYFNGSNAIITTPWSSDFDFSGDYTIDFWFYMNASPANNYQNMVFLGVDDGGNNEIEISNINSTKRLYTRQVVNGTGLWAVDVSSISALTNSAWHHLACVIHSTTATIYLDGTQIGSSSISGSRTPYYTDPVSIGNFTTQTRFFTGYIDELRFSNIARWTSNFTPSTSAYSTDVNTVLLIHFEESNAAFVDSSAANGTVNPLTISDGANIDNSSLTKTISFSKDNGAVNTDSITKIISFTKDNGTNLLDALAKTISFTKNDGSVNTDLFTSLKAKSLTISDGVPVSDSHSFAISKQITDTTNILDALTKVIGISKSDLPIVTDLLVNAISKTIPDNILGTDNLTIFKSKILTILDGTKVTDAATFIKTYVKSILENISIIDVQNFIKNYHLNIQETPLMSDNLLKSILKTINEEGLVSDYLLIYKILPFIFNVLSLND